jgi:hypothetical protein
MKRKSESMEKRLESVFSKMHPVEIFLTAVTIALVMALIVLVLVITLLF